MVLAHSLRGATGKSQELHDQNLQRVRVSPGAQRTRKCFGMAGKVGASCIWGGFSSLHHIRAITGLRIPDCTKGLDVTAGEAAHRYIHLAGTSPIGGKRARTSSAGRRCYVLTSTKLHDLPFGRAGLNKVGTGPLKGGIGVPVPKPRKIRVASTDNTRNLRRARKRSDPEFLQIDG